MTQFDFRPDGFPVAILVAFLAAGCGGTDRPNAAPIADAGSARQASIGSVVSLDGGASRDPDGDALAFQWTLTSSPAGSAATLNAASTASPGLAVDLAGTYVASLTVNDGRASSAPAAVTVTVAAEDAKRIGVAYVARNGVTTTLQSLDVTPLGNGAFAYTASFRQQNDTPSPLQEGALKLYFANAAPSTQYDFPLGHTSVVLPGPAFAVTRTHTFAAPPGATPFVLEYDTANFAAPVPVEGSLRWVFPVR